MLALEIQQVDYVEQENNVNGEGSSLRPNIDNSCLLTNHHPLLRAAMSDMPKPMSKFITRPDAVRPPSIAPISMGVRKILKKGSLGFAKIYTEKGIIN